jgi:hypothetical protein
MQIAIADEFAKLTLLILFFKENLIFISLEYRLIEEMLLIFFGCTCFANLFFSRRHPFRRAEQSNVCIVIIHSIGLHRALPTICTCILASMASYLTGIWRQ